MTIARASAARLRIPPLSSLGYFSALSCGSPTIAILAATMSRINPALSVVCSRNGTATFSARVNELNSAPCWNITPNRRWMGWPSPSSNRRLSIPNSRIVPAEGVIRPMISRNNVVLPDPLPPAIAKISPRRIDRLTSSCTTADPNRVATWLASMIGVSLCTASGVKDPPHNGRGQG